MNDKGSEVCNIGINTYLQNIYFSPEHTTNHSFWSVDRFFCILILCDKSDLVLTEHLGATLHLKNKCILILIYYPNYIT
jgi:hypothetical protein